MAAIDDFNLLAPEFSSVAPTTINAFLAFAAQDINASVWGSKADRGTALLAAHMLALSQRGSNAGAGPLIEQKAGDREQRFAPPKYRPGEEYYATTPYGVEFLRLRRTVLGDRGPLIL